jgi:hypothetical protein
LGGHGKATFVNVVVPPGAAEGSVLEAVVVSCGTAADSTKQGEILAKMSRLRVEAELKLQKEQELEESYKNAEQGCDYEYKPAVNIPEDEYVYVP